MKYVLAVIIVLIMLFPLYWMLVGSFQPITGIMKQPPSFIPSSVTLKNYAHVNAKDYKGSTPVMYAIQSDSLESVQLLIDKDADLGVKTNDGKTPLMLAAENRNRAIIRLLQEKNKPY